MKILPWLAVVLSCPCLLAQQAPPPQHSNQPLDAERVAIYRSFLQTYDSGSPTVLKVSERTEPFASGAANEQGCLAPLHLERPAAVTHDLPPDAFAGQAVKLVDPDTHQKKDPGDAIRNGQPIAAAVGSGFAGGLFTFSEIVFDASHTHAAFSYSFVCGSLCGQGTTIILVKKDGRWMTDEKARCGAWGA